MHTGLIVNERMAEYLNQLLYELELELYNKKKKKKKIINMFKDFKSQFIWLILCTFLSGVVTGINLVFLENQEVHIIFIILNILVILFTVGYWKTIFSRLNVQDRINSIYRDID